MSFLDRQDGSTTIIQSHLSQTGALLEEENVVYVCMYGTLKTKFI